MLDQFYNPQIETLIEELKSLRNQYNKLVLNEQEDAVGPTFPVNPKTFDTVLPPHEERKFRMFMGQIGRSVDENTRDYDMRGFYADHVTSEIMDTGSEEEGDVKHKFKIREGALTEKPKSKFENPSEEEQKRLAGLDIIRAGKTQISPLALGVHFPDTYKKPNHPTFSTESRYHGVADSEGRVRMGGEFKMVENHKGEKNYTFTPHPTQIDTPEEESRLIRYFRAVEPHNTLIHPSSGEYLHHPYMIATEFADEPGEASISPEDFAQMRRERMKAYSVSGDKLSIPIPMSADEVSLALGGGVPGRKSGIARKDIDVPVDLRLADVMSGTELTPKELEKMMASGVIERQMRRGVFAKKDGQGAGQIMKHLDPNYAAGFVYKTNIGNKQINFTDVEGMLSQLPERSPRITQSDIEPLTAGTDPEQGGMINKSPRYNKGNLPFTEDPIDVARFVFSDTHKRRQRGDYETQYTERSRRSILPPIEDLMKRHDSAIDELNQHISKHGFTDEEIDEVERASTEDLKDLVRKTRSQNVQVTASASKFKRRFGPAYERSKAKRDLKFKMNKIDSFQDAIENYDELKGSGQFDMPFDPTGADAESVRDLESKFDMQSLQPGDFARRRGELPIGREMFANEPRTELDPNRPVTYLDFVGGKFVPVPSPRGLVPPTIKKELDDVKRVNRLARIQRELEIAKPSRGEEEPYIPEFGDSDRPYETREVETGVDAATLRNLYKKNRKKALTKAEKVAAEEASAVQQTRNRSIMQRAMGKEEEARSTLGSRLSNIEGLTPSEIERLSAGSIRDVERMGTRATRGDLQRDLTHRAAYRRQSIPLADRPDYLKYLGESVLRLSRARTIS